MLKNSSKDILPEIAADDWGFSKGINEGILELAQNGVVKVVSLVANSPHLTHKLAELKLVPNVKFAWHLNLTAGLPMSSRWEGEFLSLKTFAWHWMTGKIPSQEIFEEAKLQLTCLRDHVGQIYEGDGHHHVHLVPGLFEILEPLYRKFGIQQVRMPMDRAHLPTYLASQLLRIQTRKYPHLNFRIYAYPQKRHFLNRQAFVSASRNGSRPVLVHPAAFDDFKGNPYGDTLCEERVEQFEFLRGAFT